MSPSFRRRWLACIAILFIPLVLTSCGEKTASAASGAEKGGGGGGKGGRGGGGPAPVFVGTVAKKKVPLVIDAIGAIEAIRTASIRSQVTGVLQKVAIKEGQDVNAGDLLFEVDPRPLRNAFDAAQADLAKLKVQLGTARAQVDRYTTLQEGQMVSKEQFQKIQDDARALESQVRAKESDVANAKLQLEYSAIRAPISGRSGNISVHEGDLVRANEASATPMVIINQLNPIYVTFGVPQQHLAAVNRYRAQATLPVRVVPPGAEEKPEVGELTFVDNVVDSTTGTIRLKGTLANTEHRLWPGQFANVTVLLAEPEVLTVPTAAIQTSQSGQHVYVVTAERIAELRSVVVERTYENDAVITKGLQEGETIVVDGQMRVIPGRPVEVKQPDGGVPGGGGGGRGKGAPGEGGKKKKKET